MGFSLSDLNPFKVVDDLVFDPLREELGLGGINDAMDSLEDGIDGVVGGAIDGLLGGGEDTGMGEAWTTKEFVDESTQYDIQGLFQNLLNKQYGPGGALSGLGQSSAFGAMSQGSMGQLGQARSQMLRNSFQSGMPNSYGRMASRGMEQQMLSGLLGQRAGMQSDLVQQRGLAQMAFTNATASNEVAQKQDRLSAYQYQDSLKYQVAAAKNAADATRDAGAMSAFGMIGAAGAGAICCFIFLEARYGDGTMDSVVRRYRDEHMTEKNRRGYYRLAEVLVPMMRASKVVKQLVRLTMTSPMVSYGKWHYTRKGIGWAFKPVAAAWLSLFDFLGGECAFIRENGEIV